MWACVPPVTKKVPPTVSIDAFSGSRRAVYRAHYGVDVLLGTSHHKTPSAAGGSNTPCESVSVT